MYENDFDRERVGGIRDWEHEEFDQLDLEQWIKASGDYIQPGSEVRPRVIEAVRLRGERRRAWPPILRLAALMLFAMVPLSMVGHWVGRRVPQGVSAAEIQYRAQQRAASTGMTLDWALSGVVHEWRRPLNESSLPEINRERK